MILKGHRTLQESQNVGPANGSVIFLGWFSSPAKNKEGGAGKKKSASPFASTLVGKSPADSKIS